MKKVLLLVSLLILITSGFAFSEEAKKLYRYTDSSGKTLYAKQYEDVPTELRSSASLVVVRADEESGDASAVKTENKGGDSVRLTSQIVYSSTGKGKTAFEGEAKNFLDSTVTGVKLMIVVVTTDGAEKTAGVFSVNGNSGKETLEPGESAKITGLLDMDYASVKKFGSSLSWQTSYMEKVAPKKEGDSNGEGKEK